MPPRVDPRTGAFITTPRPQGLPMAGPPMRSRRWRGFGDVPNSSGAQGPLIAPYDEYGLFNPPPMPPGGGNGSADSTTGTDSSGGAIDTTSKLADLISTPFGQSDRAWTNPTTFATVPINAATNISQPVLSQNFQRNFLLIQNNSTATTAGDVAPTLYIGFNAQPIVGFSLAFAPGNNGFSWDIITPRDSIYVAFGPFVNTGGSVKIQGAVVQGTFLPNQTTPTYEPTYGAAYYGGGGGGYRYTGSGG